MALGKRKAEGGGQSAEAGAAPTSKKQYRPHSSNGGRGGGGSAGSRPPAVLSRADRSALRKERRASKPHSQLIENANQLYRFDFKRMEAAERRVKIAELMERTAGKVCEVLTKHDTSRVFQLMVKYGSGEQRQRLAAECKGSLLQLCVDHYAHHFVLKLLQYGSPLVRQAVWRECAGHVAQLSAHADGAVVFDYLYASEKSKRQQADMLRELMHPQFAVEAQTEALTASEGAQAAAAAATPRSGGGALAELCASHPTLAASMVTQVGGLVERWLNKGQLQYRFVHALLRQYLDLPAQLLPPANRADLISSLCASPALSALCGSNDGVLVLCTAVSAGVAKDRKQVMRCLKADALTVCRSLYGHLLLMRVTECVDDTVAVDKNVWSGLLATPHAVSQLLDDVHGAKVVRFMLRGKADSQFLSPFEAAFQRQAQPNSAANASDGSGATAGLTVDAASGGSSGGSKKDSVLRHEEHLAHCLLPLLSVFQLDDYIRDNPPSRTAAQVATQAAAAGDAEEEEEGEAAAERQEAVASLELLLRSSAASPVLLELLHTAQATVDAAESSLKAAALVALRAQVQAAVDAALDQLALLALSHSERQSDRAKEEEKQSEQDESGGAVEAAVATATPAPSLLEDRTAHYFFKRLLAPNAKPNDARLQSGDGKRRAVKAASGLPSASSDTLARHFAERLLRTFHSSPTALTAASSSSRGCFVLLALVEALDSAQQRSLAVLCRQQAVHSRLEQTLKRHHEQPQQQQQQQVEQLDAATGKRRKHQRTQRRAAEAAATAPPGSVRAEEGGGSAAAVTGCRLLQAWLDGQQAAAATATGSKAASVEGSTATSAVSQAHRAGSKATPSKRTRAAVRD